MSEPAADREWRFYIDDMISFCERVQSFTQGINQLIHGYAGIDDDILWSIIETDVPSLLHELLVLRDSLPR